MPLARTSQTHASSSWEPGPCRCLWEAQPPGNRNHCSSEGCSLLICRGLNQGQEQVGICSAAGYTPGPLF